MKKLKNILLTCLVILTAATASIGNTVPVANAGIDQNVNIGSRVILDGTGSYDADGDRLKYIWSFISKPAGSTAILRNAKKTTPSFEVDVYGLYILQLIVNDRISNSLPDTVEVNVILPADTIPPVITVTGNDPETVIQDTAYTDAGATATDDRDGTVAVTATGSVDTSTVGTYTLTYTATDAAGNTATATRTVNVVLPADTTPPVITVTGNDPETVIQDTAYTDAGATATDDRDGTVAVTATGSVDTSTVGTYTLTYTASDAAGNSASETRTVNVVLASDTTAPVITLNGANPMEVTQGDIFTDPGATATDERDGSVTVLITGSVDTSTVGTYTITYTATDAAGNTATATKTVNVVLPADTTPPVITVTGNDPETVIQDTAYTDAGATATDDRDGTVAVTATGSVDTSTVGTYTLTYTASDAAGNSASETRTVTVVEAGNGPVYGTELVMGGGNDNGAINKYDWVELGDLYGIKTRSYNNNIFLYPNQKYNNGGCYQAIPTVVGKQYKVAAILLGTDANSNEIFSSTNASYLTIESSAPALNSVPDHLTNMVTGSTETTETFIFTATSTTSYISLRSTKAYNYPNARAISVKEILGEPGVDTTPPVITINGSNPMTIIQGETYIELGATATDNVDGTVAVTTAGSVDTDTVATYTITYTATDAANNSASAMRTVTVVEAGNGPVYGTELVMGGGNDNGAINKSDWIALGDLYGIKTRLYNNNTFLYPNQKYNNGGCYQAIPTVVGKQYNVSAILLGTDANRNEIFSSSNASYITIDRSVPTPNGTPDHLTNMITGSTETTETFIFTATSTTSYISLRSTKAYNYPNARAISVKEVLGEGAPLRLIVPLTGSIKTDSMIIAKAEAVLQDGWGIKFILDGVTEMIDYTVPYEADFNNVSQGEHTIDAYIVDNSDTEQSGEDNHDSVHHIGTGGDILVTVGNSITEGQGDDDSSDDTSADGRNTGGGFEPILNNLLTFEKGYPHSIYNEGLGGELSRGGLLRLPGIITKYPDATTYLVMYGTNDAADWNDIPSGLGLTAEDINYTNSFKANMQQMIDLIKNDGKKVILAKIPRVLGSTAGSSVSADPDSLERNINIRGYNDVIDELVSENSIITVPPDFYFEFENTYGDGPLGNGYFDPLHPNGEGYNSMAEWWADTLY